MTAPGREAPAVVLPPEPVGYRVKRWLLGPPLGRDQLVHERLGKPTALAVFASDNLSSAAYATEEILHVLVPAVGVAAFALVVPLTLAMVGVLGLLVVSYRQTIRAYPSAGGAYVVTRDNFGLLAAQVAGVALLTDYVLTVAVSVAAGTAALSSAAPGLRPWSVPLSLGFVVLIAYANLRGVRESGRMFAVPTYFFLANMGLLLAVAAIRAVFGHLPVLEVGGAAHVAVGPAGAGLAGGASAFVVLHAFASGGAAVTGVEAISNGVPAFRPPEWRNARTTLAIMAALLGAMFLGLSALAARMHVVPYARGTPTVISVVAGAVYGDSLLGRGLYYGLQAATMAILVLAANTSFADFPRLASFHAGDDFLPHQLAKRGHRLVYSNGIVFLAVASGALVVITGAEVSRLIPLYAIGVFTSFTFSQLGMARHHLRRRQPGWRRGLAINGAGGAVSAVVDVVIAVTKFTHGAWVVILLVPAIVALLMRMAHQYQEEDRRLARDLPRALGAHILRRHVVLVLVDRLDRATARALQYGRALAPDELRAVHFVVDDRRAESLAEAWSGLVPVSIPLELVNCPNRRIARCALATAAEAAADGDTEVTVLVPDRIYGGPWGRLLHDDTAYDLARVIRLPHVNVTTVPFHVGGRYDEAPAGDAGAGAPAGGAARRVR